MNIDSTASPEERAEQERLEAALRKVAAQFRGQTLVSQFHAFYCVLKKRAQVIFQNCDTMPLVSQLG